MYDPFKNNVEYLKLSLFYIKNILLTDFFLFQSYKYLQCVLHQICLTTLRSGLLIVTLPLKLLQSNTFSLL